MLNTRAASAFLRLVADTGNQGFEGLICTVLDAETGQRFVRVWSGNQRGRDAQSTTMAMEAKHYRASTLKQRELIAEIEQATEIRPRPELWLLVTTVAVDPDKWQELVTIAGKRGLDIFAIDGARRGLSRLSVLLAAHRADVLAFAADNYPSTDLADLGADLDAIAAHPNFLDVLAELRTKLRSTLFGYADAARRCHTRLLRILGHEGDAFSEFAQPAAVRAPAASLVRRVEPLGHLTQWLNVEAKKGVHAAVLGEDGVGKTWAVLDWLAEVYSSGQQIVVLPFSATVLALTEHQTISDVLPVLLTRWTEVGDNATWNVRLHHWLRDDSLRPLILVVADGLSERTDVGWPDFFRTVTESALTGRVAVLATDRPVHWALLDGPLAARGFQTNVTVAFYTDRELSEALAGSGIDFKNIPTEMLPLIKTARYCRLTVRHYAALRAEGDLTRERLLYIDARERRVEKSRYPISEDDFTQIIKGAARRHREIARTLSASDIRQMIPFRERERDVYSELTTNGVFVRDGKSDRFRVEPARLAYALGLLLSETVREDTLGGAAPEAIANGIAKWFEPERDMDLKVEAAGGALFHAAIDESFPAAGKRELLRYWLGLRNWGKEASAAFGSYILRMPEDFVAMAEHFWATANDLGAAQALLGRVFCEHRDAVQVRPHLVAATERWFGFVHVEGLPFLRQVASSGPAEPSRDEIAERVAAIIKLTATTLPPLASITDDGLLRLSGVGLLIASARSRLPFARGLITRALAASAMGMDNNTNEAAWVVRLAEPELLPVLLEAASRLIATGDPSCISAAHRLIGAAADKASRALLDNNPAPRHRSHTWLDRHKEDPCTSGFALSLSECSACLARLDVSVESLLRGCRKQIAAGNISVPHSFVDRCLAALNDILPEKIAAAFSFTYEDHLVAWMETVLASAKPTELAEFWREIVHRLPDRDVDQISNFAHKLPGLVIALTPAELGALNSCRAILDSAADEPGRHPDAGDPYNQFHLTSAQFAMAALAHTPPDERWNLIHRRPLTAFDAVNLVNWYNIPPLPSYGSQVEALKVIRRDGTDRIELLRALYFITECKTVLDDETRAAVLHACQHEESAVRGSALRLVDLAGDDDLVQKVISLGDVYHRDEFWPAVNGSNLIVRHGTALPVCEIVARLHPASWTFVAHRQRRPDADLDVLAEALDDVWRHVIADPTNRPRELPSITKGPDEISGLGWPVSDDEQDTSQTNFLNGSWLAPRPATKPILSVKAEMNERIRRREARTAALQVAWQTDAFAWFGRTFDAEGLRIILQRRPDLRRLWAATALDAGPRGKSLRLQLATFFQALAEALFGLEPALGLQVWTKLADDSGANFLRSTIAEIPFRSDSQDAVRARERIIEACWTDAQLGQVAVAASRNSCADWLQTQISELVQSHDLWRRAKGLCLASLSVMGTPTFEAYVQTADVTNTWVGDQIDIFRHRHLLYQRGLYWFGVFGTAEDDVAAWGAWRMLVTCADARWTTWPGCWHEPAKARRLAFLAAAESEIKRACEEADRERQDTFLGLRISRGEVFPFMRL